MVTGPCGGCPGVGVNVGDGVKLALSVAEAVKVGIKVKIMVGVGTLAYREFTCVCINIYFKYSACTAGQRI